MSASCYMWQSGKLSAALKTFFKCSALGTNSPFVSCCNSGDFCLNNGFCQHKDVPVGGSGIYTGACTDPSLSDPSCMSRCKNQPNSEVVYVNTTWYCCGGDASKPQCNDPQAPGFGDLSPYELIQTASIVDIGSNVPPQAVSQFPSTVTIPAFTSGQSIAAIGTATPTASFDPSAPVKTAITTDSTTTLVFASGATPTAVSSPTAPASDSSLSSHISTGAIIGLSIGVVILVALAAAGLWYFCTRENHKSAQRARRNDASSPGRIEAIKRPNSSYHTYTPNSSSRGGGASNSSRSANTRAPPTPGSARTPVSPLTPHGVSRFTSRGARPRNQEIYEMQSPLGPGIYELPAESQPTELMVNTSVEDRMAGGGPDRQLPVLPTPSTPQGGHAREPSDTYRYQSILTPT